MNLVRLLIPWLIMLIPFLPRMVAILNTSYLSLPLSYTFHMLCLISSLLLNFLNCSLTRSCTLSLPHSIQYTLPYTLFPTLSSGSVSSAHSQPSLLYAFRLFIAPTSFCSLAHPYTHTPPLSASLTLTLTHSLTHSLNLSLSFSLFRSPLYPILPQASLLQQNVG